MLSRFCPLLLDCVRVSASENNLVSDTSITVHKRNLPDLECVLRGGPLQDSHRKLMSAHKAPRDSTASDHDIGPVQQSLPKQVAARGATPGGFQHVTGDSAKA